MEKLKLLLKYIFLFFIGGGIYYGVEILWRGYSHWSMFGLGGICFIFAGFQNECISWDYPFWKQVLRTELIVLVSEFLTGCIVNLWLGWNVWDYSGLPFSLHGQINLFFSIAWIVLSAIAIVVDDWLRYWWFNEEKPHYKLF